MRSTLVRGAAVAFASAVVIWGCGGSSGYGSSPSSPSTPNTPSGASMTVNIIASSGSGAFNPNPVPANAGDTIAFKNGTTDLHHIVLDDGSADLGEVAAGQTSKIATVKANGAKFHCLIHSSMVGAINGPIPDPPPCMTPGYCD